MKIDLKELIKMLESRASRIEEFIDKVGETVESWDDEEVELDLGDKKKRIMVNGYNWCTDYASKYFGKLQAVEEIIKDLKELL